MTPELMERVNWMFNLPETTEFNKRIPKQKFYENLSVTPELKRVFAQQIGTIYWRNKIAATTVNVAAGKTVSELEVFEIRLNQPELSTAALQLIDREIPYHILFVLTYDGKAQAWIGYKEASLSKKDSFKVGSYYHTDWTEPQKLNLQLQGLDMDAVYASFVRQIAGQRLQVSHDSSARNEATLKESVERDERRQQLQKQIAALEKRIGNEKQFNRQVELNAELKARMREFENQG